MSLQSLFNACMEQKLYRYSITLFVDLCKLW